MREQSDQGGTGALDFHPETNIHAFKESVIDVQSVEPASGYAGRSVFGRPSAGEGRWLRTRLPQSFICIGSQIV